MDYNHITSSLRVLHPGMNTSNKDQEEKSFDKGDDANDGQWITIFTISSPGGFGSVELKAKKNL